MKPLKYSWFGHEKKLFRTKTLNYPKLLSPTKDWGEHLPGTFRNEIWVWSKHIFYVTLYKEKDKNKDADRINETLLVCYIFGILMTQAFLVWWWIPHVTNLSDLKTLRPWDLETLWPWDLEILRPWDLDTLRPWDLETLKTWDLAT